MNNIFIEIYFSDEKPMKKLAISQRFLAISDLQRPNLTSNLSSSFCFTLGGL